MIFYYIKPLPAPLTLANLKDYSLTPTPGAVYVCCIHCVTCRTSY